MKPCGDQRAPNSRQIKAIVFPTTPFPPRPIDEDDDAGKDTKPKEGADDGSSVAASGRNSIRDASDREDQKMARCPA
jgi:hypothetical protein